MMTRQGKPGPICTVHGGTRWISGYCERWSGGSPQRSGEEWRALGPCLLPEPTTTARALHQRMLERIAQEDTPMMSKTAATKKARSEVVMYRQGRGWIVSVYDHRARATRLSHEMRWPAALAFAREAREDRAQELLGIPTDERRYSRYQ